MNRKKPFDVTFQSWEDLIEGLRSDYTLSFKDVCVMLKASRTWVNQYVRPNVPAVYINSNHRGTIKLGVNWVQVASIELEKPMTESIWFHEKDFFNFLDSCTFSVTKQTKSIPVTYLMNEENKTNYLEKMKKLDKQLIVETSLKKKIKLLEEKNKCYIDFLKKDNATQYLIENKKTIIKRKQVEPVPVALNYTSIPTEDWKAPHDLKKYGDADELIYRNFFAEGYIRMELHLPDANGVIGKKIFYTEDREYLKGEGTRIIVAESDWLNYLEKKQS